VSRWKMHGSSFIFPFGLLLTGCGGGVNSQGADKETSEEVWKHATGSMQGERRE
jgi:hypothetical protein